MRFKSFDYHHDNILGTAMDLRVVALTRADADIAEAAALREIRRLQSILSSYQSDSELAKLNASPVGGPGLPGSPELIDVLKKYEFWSKRTDGAYSGHAGALLALWKQAETNNVLPTDADGCPFIVCLLFGLDPLAEPSETSRNRFDGDSCVVHNHDRCLSLFRATAS